MRESVTISRASVKDNEARFAALKERGVELAQKVSGDIWSDFNAHDPGVTILEQLCYVITELTFHADFDVADVLLNDDGVLDYRAQSLHLPEEVFPCRPTTVNDLRQMLLDSVKEIDNVWLSRVEVVVGENRKGLQGLYRAEVRRSRNAQISDDTLIVKINSAYHQQRNLGENLECITILQDKDCMLHAKIEIDNSQHADELLAEIYYRCGEYVAGNIPLDAYTSKISAFNSLEQLFEGPLTQHGLFNLQDNDTANEVLVSSLFTIINSISGVDHIKGLSLELDGQQYYEVLPRRDGGTVLSLNIPETTGAIKIELIRNGGVLPVMVSAVKKRYCEMTYRRDSMREVVQDFSALYSLPEGQVKELGHYTSMQAHFPAIYGINHFGVGGESEEAVAKTRQLKSYLLMFEQVMANFSASCARLNKLYSIDASQRHTYGYQVINDDMIAEVGLLYPAQPEEAISTILSKYDDYFERKGRVLDYLLALYGQKFTQKTLRYFNYYYQDSELDKVIVENKITCLASIIRFDKDRAAGINLSQPVWNTDNVAGLQYRLSILLGFKYVECRSLTIPLVKLGLKVLSHDDYCSTESGSRELKAIDLSDIKEHVMDGFYPVAYRLLDVEQAVINVTDNLELFVPLKNNIISDSLLQGGVSLERFRVGSLAPDNDYQMMFNAEGERDWWYIGRAETREEAEENILQLHRFLIHLNIESEGLHIVDHLLLRSSCDDQHSGDDLYNDDNFYSSRISVIFPSWTARTNDPRFRRMVEDSVINNCPAHIFSDIYWLDFDQMYRFEGLYKNWLDVRANDAVATDKANYAAYELKEFLQEQLSNVNA